MCGVCGTTGIAHTEFVDGAADTISRFPVRSITPAADTDSRGARGNAVPADEDTGATVLVSRSILASTLVVTPEPSAVPTAAAVSTATVTTDVDGDATMEQRSHCANACLLCHSSDGSVGSEHPPQEREIAIAGAETTTSNGDTEQGMQRL